MGLKPKIVSRDEWIEARKKLLIKEKEFNRRRDQLSQERREMPWEPVSKKYVFEGPNGKETLAQLFDGTSQLIVYHFMFNPDWEAGCPHCSFWADNFDRIPIHLKHRDVTFVAISRARYPKLEAYRKRMGWSFKWLSSFGSDFNFDYFVSFTPDEVKNGTAYYNYERQKPSDEDAVGISVGLNLSIVCGIVCIVAISWIYLLSGAGMTMEKMDMGGGKTMLMPPSWSIGYAALTFAMWSIMMVAMMLASAAPTILRLVRVTEKHPSGMSGVATAVFFTAGYLAIWTGFSAIATTAQWALDSAHLLSETMAIRSVVAAGLMIIAVGLYQLSAVKRTCLRHCCSSVKLLADNQSWSSFAIVQQGLSYGISCLGCCWALMCLLFVVGVMNVIWIAAIAVWLLAEKTLPSGLRIARVAGVALIGWGSIALAIAMH